MNVTRRSVVLALLSLASLLGGVAGLVHVERREARVEVTEVARIEYDPGFSPEERAAIADVARRAVPDVARALPALPVPIVLRVGKSRDVIPETGESAESWQPNVVRFVVDPNRDALGIVRQWLRSALFHELHHVVRGAAIVDRDLHDDLVREGLATVFERDATGVMPPWGRPPPEIDAWTTEVLALPNDAPRSWLYRAPDGQRWVGMRVGTALALRAMVASGKTSAELARTPTADVLRFATGAQRP